MNKNIIVPVLIVSLFALAGCNASKGLGKDVENAGKSIQETVEKNQ